MQEDALDIIEKEEQIAIEVVTELEQGVLNLRYEVDKLRVSIREKEMVLVKAKFNAKKIASEKRVATRAFWSKKNGG